MGLIGPTYPQVSATKTVGSWRIAGKCSEANAWLIDSAVAFSSAAVGQPPAAMHFGASLKLRCNPIGTFEGGGSVVEVSPGSDVPGFLIGIPIPIAVIADGKEVGRFDWRKPLDLSTVFGPDLAKLTPVKTLEIATVPLTGGGSPTTIFKASLDQTAAALDFMRTIALSRRAAETLGSWTLSAADGLATAVVDKTAIVTDTPAANKGFSDLRLEYSADLEFSHEWFECGVPPGSAKDAIVRLLANGREVQQRKAVWLQNGLEIFQFELTTTFGKDLKGLVPIRNIKAILTADGAETVLYEANLSRTGDALQRLIEMAKASKRECAEVGRVRGGPFRAKRPLH